MAIILMASGLAASTFTSTLGGTLPGQLPLFPRNNWWNTDISTAPVDLASAGNAGDVAIGRR